MCVCVGKKRLITIVLNLLYYQYRIQNLMLKGDFLFQDILTLARLNISKVSYSLIGTVSANSHA